MEKGLVKGLLSILSSSVLTVFVGAITTPLLARLLGSSAYGNYAFLLSILSIATIITNGGIFDGMRKFISEKRDFPDWEENVFRFYFRFAMGTGLLASICFVAFGLSGLAGRIFSPVFNRYFYLLAVLVFARQIRSVVRGGLMGKKQEHVSEPLIVIYKILIGLLGVPLVYLGYSVGGVLVGHIISISTISFIGLWVLTNEFDLSTFFHRVPNSFPRKELVSFNISTVVLILCIFSLYHIDIILLRSMTGSGQTGYYRAALVVAEFLWFGPMALQTVLLHSTSNLWLEGQQEKISELSSKLTRFNILLTTLLIIGLAALASDFIPLYYGQEYEPAILPLLLLLPGTFGFSIARPILAIGQAKGDLLPLIAATGTAGVMNIGLNIYLIPSFGMNGAAIATSISYGSMLVFHLLASRWVGFNPVMDLRITKIFLTGIITSPFVFGLAWILKPPFSLIITPIVGFMIYSSASIYLGALDHSEIDDIIDSLPAPIKNHAVKLLNILS